MSKAVFYRNESVSGWQRSAGWVFDSSLSPSAVLMLMFDNLSDTHWGEVHFPGEARNSSMREETSQGEGY